MDRNSAYTGRMNKKIRILSLIVAALAVFSSIGVKTFLGPCVHEDGTFGVCRWAGQAMFGISLLIGAEGLAAVFWKNNEARRGILFSMAAASVLGICIPGRMIGLCSMAVMRCRALMQPAMTILFAVMGIISAVGCLLIRKE